MNKKDMKFLKQAAVILFDQNPKIFNKKEDHYNKFHNKRGKVVQKTPLPTGGFSETKSPPGMVRRRFDPIKALYKKFVLAWEQIPLKEREHDYEKMLPKLITKLQEMGVKLI